MEGRSAARELMRAYDTLLDPHRLPYDQVMETNRFARAERPQCAKMCFLLHTVALNSHLEARIANMNCR